MAAVPNREARVKKERRLRFFSWVESFIQLTLLLVFISQATELICRLSHTFTHDPEAWMHKIFSASAATCSR